MKDYKPYFSIIITCKNEDRYLKKTVMSVLSQNFDDYEIVISDGGSTDNTISILEELSENEHVRVFSEKDNGIFSGMNRGIRYSRGEYLQFINVRDFFADNDVLLKTHDYLIAHNEPDILIGDFIWNTLFSYSHSKVTLDDLFYRNLRYSWGVCHQGVFAKRDTLKDGFDEKYKYKADYAWFCDQYLNGASICEFDKEIVVFDSYGTSNQLSHRRIGDIERKQITYERFDDAPEVWKEKHVSIDFYNQQLINEAVEKKLRLINIMFYLCQKGIDLGSLIHELGYDSIAIYGMKELGKRLFDELSGSSVKVKYVMDKSKKICDKYTEYITESMYKECLNSVQAVFVTPLLSFIEIKDVLRERGCSDCEIVPIERIIGDVLWILNEKNVRFFEESCL